MSHYQNLKTNVQGKRKMGLPVSRNEISELNESLKTLEKNLKIIQESPMEYEMYCYLNEIEIIVIIISHMLIDLQAKLVEDLLYWKTLGNKWWVCYSFLIFSACIECDLVYQAQLNSSDTKLTRNSFGNQNAGETTNPLTMSDRGLIQRQQEVMQQQDAMLGQIEKGVDRLHSQVSPILT